MFKKYETEVKEKWGETLAYTEYTQKTKDYKDEKWQETACGLDEIFMGLANLMKNGKAYNSAEALEQIRALKAHITHNYYTCTNEILLGLGEMYVNDSRFKEHIDQCGGGTAEFTQKAINVFLENEGKNE